MSNSNSIIRLYIKLSGQPAVDKRYSGIVHSFTSGPLQSTDLHKTIVVVVDGCSQNFVYMLIAKHHFTFL